MGLFSNPGRRRRKNNPPSSYSLNSLPYYILGRSCRNCMFLIPLNSEMAIFPVLISRTFIYSDKSVCFEDWTIFFSQLTDNNIRSKIGRTVIHFEKNLLNFNCLLLFYHTTSKKSQFNIYKRVGLVSKIQWFSSSSYYTNLITTKKIKLCKSLLLNELIFF